MEVTPTPFERWIGDREIQSVGTNSGAEPLAFQDWHRFKEAFAPELIQQALGASGSVERCLDPFGGSGTTALACQFLGVNSTTIEVNPFLADVIRAKLTHYEPTELERALEIVMRGSADLPKRLPDDLDSEMPETFIQPGVGDRWLFSEACAIELLGIANAVAGLDDPDHSKLFRVLLGGILVGVSNATVNGKGRRYRRNWEKREQEPTAIRKAFRKSAEAAIADVGAHGDRPLTESIVIEGDARSTDIEAGSHDISVFSPPYPNSFDYTDVYNIELWMLGYLRLKNDNKTLRRSTLSSHVQISREFQEAPTGSATLDATLERLVDAREKLWSPWIPEMVGGYFADLMQVLERVGTALRANGTAWLVVGDSRYAGIDISTGQVLVDLAARNGWSIEKADPFRSMRSSAQQGGRDELAETLLIMSRESDVQHAPASLASL